MSVKVLDSWEGGSTTSNSLTITIVPSELFETNTLLALVVKTGITSTIPPSVDWDLVQRISFSSSILEIWKKLITGSEPLSYTWTGDLEDYIGGIHHLHRADYNNISLVQSNTGIGLIPETNNIIGGTLPTQSLMLSGYACEGSLSLIEGNEDFDEQISKVDSSLALWTGALDFHKVYFNLEDTLSTGDAYKVVSVDVSSDGLNLVLGTEYQLTGDALGRVFSYHRISKSDPWAVSSSILEGAPFGALLAVGLGRSLSLSGDGLYLVVGTDASRTFQYSRITVLDDWTYKGYILADGQVITNPIPTPGIDYSGLGRQVKLSQDTMTLLISIPHVYAKQSRPKWKAYRPPDERFSGSIITLTRPDVSSEVWTEIDYYNWDGVPEEGDEDRGGSYALSSWGVSADLNSIVGSHEGFYGWLRRAVGTTNGGAGSVNRYNNSSLFFSRQSNISVFDTDTTIESFVGLGMSSDGLSMLVSSSKRVGGSSQDLSVIPMIRTTVNHRWRQLSKRLVLSGSPSLYVDSVSDMAISLDGSVMIASLRYQFPDGSNDFQVSGQEIPAVVHSVSNSVPWIAVLISIGEIPAVSETLLTPQVEILEKIEKEPRLYPEAHQDIYEVDQFSTLVVPDPGVMDNDEFVP